MSLSQENTSSTDNPSTSHVSDETQRNDENGLYESQDYLPPHNQVYLSWLKRQPPRLRAWDKWLMFGLIGLATGVTGFFLHQFIDTISNTKWNIAKDYINKDKSEYANAWILSLLYRLVFNQFNINIITVLKLFQRRLAAA